MQRLALQTWTAAACFCACTILLPGRKGGRGRSLQLTFLTVLRGRVSHLPPGFVFCLPSLLPSTFAPMALGFKELFLGQPSSLCESHATRVLWRFALNILPLHRLTSVGCSQASSPSSSQLPFSLPPFLSLVSLLPCSPPMMYQPPLFLWELSLRIFGNSCSTSLLFAWL